MFERFTEKARRVVFYGRHEALQYGSPYIEPEHLLIGILREDKAIVSRFARPNVSVESIRKEVEAHFEIREKIKDAIEIPLSEAGKRVLKCAPEEADRLSHKYIGTEHLLLALLREEKGLAAELLQKWGLKLSVVREELARQPRQDAPQSGAKTSALHEFSQDLTTAAAEGNLTPFFGREQELARVIEILGSLNHKNPLLIGEAGTGKTAIVEGLSQRIADYDVPSFLVDKRILLLDLSLLTGSTKNRDQLEGHLKSIVKELMERKNSIVFIEEVHSLVGAGSATGLLDTTNILRPALLRGDIQCISTSTPGEYQKAVQAAPWLANCFRTVEISSPDAENVILVLQGRREEYEKFHQVAYSDEAVRYAAYYSTYYFRASVLAKAMEVLDAAGSRVKLRQSTVPEEVAEIQKRVRFISNRMERAISNHEFEKARFYSEEERKEKESLRALREHYKLDEPSTPTVSRDDIEEAVSRLTGVSITSIRKEQSTGRADPTRSVLDSAASSGTQKGPTLNVFLCHSSKDKPAVRDIYKRLKENRIEPWLDEENLLPGQEWDYEISNAVRRSHVVIVCLSTLSVSKAGYVHREIKKVLDVADEQPEGTIYVIPLKLEECEVPSRLKRWHWVNFFEQTGFEKLMQALLKRARALGLSPSPGSGPD